MNNEWKNAFWRNGKGNTLRQFVGTGMAGLQKVWFLLRYFNKQKYIGVTQRVMKHEASVID